MRFSTIVAAAVVSVILSGCDSDSSSTAAPTRKTTGSPTSTSASLSTSSSVTTSHQGTTSNAATSTTAATTTAPKTSTTPRPTGPPDVPTAISEVMEIVGAKHVLRNGAMPSVFIPQYQDIQPAAVVQPADAGELVRVLDAIHRNFVPFVVRSTAGNSFAGQSTVAGGIVVQMSRFTDIEVDADGFLASAFVAKIGAGTRLLEVYTRLYSHDPPVSINGGSCPSVSISGLVQGGAYGYSSTMHGMLADHVLAVDIVVQEDGEFKLIHATRDNEHADLIKALRGGMGGNFGVVTTWHMDAIRASENTIVYRHHVAPDSKTQADYVSHTKAYQQWMINQPKSYGLWGKVKIHSNFEMHYEGQCLCDPFSGDCGDCNNLMATANKDVFNNGNWLTSQSEMMTNAAYAGWSWAGCTKWADRDCPTDAVFPGAGVDPTRALEGCWNYDVKLNHNSPWKSNSVYVKQEDMTDALWDTLWDLSHQPECKKGRNVCIITFEYYGGKMLEEPKDCAGVGPCTSFVHRHQGWNIQVSSLWNRGDNAGEVRSTRWVAEAFAAIDQHSSLHTSYQNYISDQWTVAPWKDEFFPGQNVKPDHWKLRYFGPSNNGVYNRLQNVKCKYNPRNLFSTPRIEHIVVQLKDDCE